jgi:peptidoglycan/LPS O-acetylase OafA/YrhL
MHDASRVSSPTGQKPETSPARESAAISREKYFDLRLQSIRGLAALIVAFHHSFNLFPFPVFPARILRAVENVVSPQAAILTFFILSGYVLGLSLGKTSRIDPVVYLQFVVKRICRIMLPLMAVVTVTSLTIAGLIWYVTGQNFVDAGSWAENSLMRSSYFRPLQLNVLMGNLQLVDHDLDPVTWTITIEMVGSMLIPFFYRLNQAFYPRLFLLLGLITISMLCQSGEASFWHYLYIFDLGLLIPFWGRFAFPFLKRKRLLAGALCLALVLCLINGHFGHNFYLLSPALSFLLGFVIFHDNRCLRLLDSRSVIWLGKVSYSFYLLHWPVMWVIAWLFSLNALSFKSFHPILMSFAILVLSVPLTAVLAEVFYNRVELPSIQLGKRVINLRF